MKTGLIHSYAKRQPVYRKLKRQIVLEFQPDIAKATGWRKYWLRWKRAMVLEIRYNNLLYLTA